jgi:hypothetical protein
MPSKQTWHALGDCEAHRNKTLSGNLLRRALDLWDGIDYSQLEAIYTNLLGTILYIKGGMQ